MRALVFSLLLLLVGCTTHYQSQDQTVEIADGVQLQLLSSIPFDNGMTLTQSATAEYNDEHHDLIFQTEILSDKLTMVGLTPTGTRLFTIVMKDGMIDATGLSAMVDSIKPEYLLADLQLSLWPKRQLLQHLNNADLLEPNPLKREIVNDGIPIITIDYSQPTKYQGTIRFNHLERGYSLVIAPLAIEMNAND
ncbi:DUF3261 domain-containing protein [Kangiella marina]|uniref:DUF3261 domain-containing protein n=1 Tax=Kangiella marina TaxID=1079178 RepID=A0ABP8IJT3_9GAMM